MSNKIMIINPWGVDYMDGLTEEVVAPCLGADTQVVCTSLGSVAAPLPWPTPSGRSPTIETARKAEADGFDAIVIGCAADPFLAETRSAVSIPVVGVTETVCASVKNRGKVAILARRLSDAYLPLIPSQGNWDFWTDTAKGYGLADGDFCMRRVNVPAHPDPDALERMTREDPLGLRDATVEAMDASLHAEGLAAAEAAVADGAQALFFACAFWSKPIASLGSSAAAKFCAPVINPLVSAATYAEHLVASAA